MEQGSLNMSISSAFEQILRAQRVVCNGHNSSSSKWGSEASRNAARLRPSVDSEYNNMTWNENYNNLKDDDDDSENSASRAGLCGDYPAIKIYRRHGNDSDSRSSNQTNNVDAIVIKSYEAMKSNVSMISNVTTDHAAPIFLKEVAPAVYSSLLTHPSYSSGTSNTGIIDNDDKNNDIRIFDSSSIPMYRLYSYPLPKINYSNEIYVDRGYLGATMIVLYMLIITIVSVRAVTHMRKSGVKLQLHIAGKQLFNFNLDL